MNIEYKAEHFLPLNTKITIGSNGVITMGLGLSACKEYSYGIGRTSTTARTRFGLSFSAGFAQPESPHSKFAGARHCVLFSTSKLRVRADVI